LKLAHCWSQVWGDEIGGLDKNMMKDKLVTQQRMRTQTGRADDGLGPNSDIGARLRALYGAVQDEGVPGQLLDLLEKLDSAESAQQNKKSARDGE
jgi:hypothetical protein